MRSPSEMWERQRARGDLATAYWDIAGARPGMRVADVGCSAGYFSVRYAHLVGPAGHVHAVDVDEPALAYLRSRLDDVHHAMVTTERLDVARAPLPSLHFDRVFCTDMLHHVPDVEAVLRNLRVSGAPLLIGEFDPRAPHDLGPPLHMRLAPETLLTALKATGWQAREWHALPHEHYCIVAKP